MESGALARWRQHLEEVMGVEDAAAVVDPFYTVDWSNLATKDDLERFATKDDLEYMGELLTERLTARFRREIMLHSTGQFFALVLAVAALVTLG